MVHGPEAWTPPPLALSRVTLSGKSMALPVSPDSPLPTDSTSQYAPCAREVIPMTLFYSELSALVALLVCMLALNASPAFHPYLKADLLPRFAFGGMAVMLVTAALAFIVSGR